MLLNVDHLHTQFHSGGQLNRAVDDISFSIDRGETLCLVGESGSGKSVTALSIMRLLPSALASHPRGTIHFDYRPDGAPREQARTPVELLSLPEERLRAIRGARIGMIFQEPMSSLNPVLTVGQQIVEALLLHRPGLGSSEARQLAIDALEQVRIADAERRFDDFPHRLSGGQRQRVMIAMAMACEPDLLIADEPTTALDVTVQAEILRLMRDLQERNGMAILFITHDFGVVSQMADRVAVMRLGKIVESGGRDELLRRPHHSYTQQLLAALPENLAHRRRERGEMATRPTHSNLSATAITRDTQDPLLEIRGLQVHFPIRKGLLRRTVDWVRAVDGVDLTLSRGQILAVVGESGSGKSTLGRALLRLIEPTAGSIRFQGREITTLQRRAMRPLRRAMQVVFQDPQASLNPRLTVATALTEPMAVHAIGSSIEERIERAAAMLESVQLERDHLWRYPHELSGGQRQRIGIARALVLEPRFLVCDEITSALDVSVQAEILEILLQLRESHDLTLLFITHNIAVVEYLCDETCVMYQGKIIERGPTDSLCRAPQERYTQQLLAAVPRVAL